MNFSKLKLCWEICAKSGEIPKFLIILLILRESFSGSQSESGLGLIWKAYYEKKALQIFKLQSWDKFFIIISWDKVSGK